MPTPVGKELPATPVKPDRVRDFSNKSSEQDSVDFGEMLKQNRSKQADEPQQPQARQSHKPHRSQKADKARDAEQSDCPAQRTGSTEAVDTRPANESAGESLTIEQRVVASDLAPTNTPAPQIEVPSVTSEAAVQVTAEETKPLVATYAASLVEHAPAGETAVESDDVDTESAEKQPARPIAFRGETKPVSDNEQLQRSVAQTAQDTDIAKRTISDVQPIEQPAPKEKPAHENSLAQQTSTGASDQTTESRPTPVARPKVDEPIRAPADSPKTSPTVSADRQAAATSSPQFELSAPTSAGTDSLVARPQESTPAPSHQTHPAPTAPTQREIEFAARNHDQFVTAIRTQLLPKGGSMQIRLDPPQLGTLHLAVTMDDGVMSVAFQTSSDEATRLLSHSLTQLKHVLESHGLSVDKLNVQQAPRDHDATRQDSQQQRQDLHDESTARQHQQRQEMLRRMWRRLALGDDPLDLVA